ncbi:MAG: M48 family metalloprotease, partial [Candidatus Paceibacterales bacterium]
MVKNKILLIVIFVFLSSVGYAYASFTIEDEKKVGKEFYEKMDKSGILYHDARVATYISQVGNHILSYMPKSPFEYHFSVIKSSAVNAFATPGGYVYVNVGLINLVENESELAGVLSHEIGHVTARHVADIIEKSQKVNIATLAAILAGAFLGGGGDATAAIAGFSMATATTLNLKYSREHEEEADRLGLSYLTQAGYDGTSMIDFLKTMRQYEFYSSSVPSYFLTHPGTDERIRYLDALLQTKYVKTGSKSIFGQLKRVQILLMLDQKNLDVNLKYFQSALEKKLDDVDYLYGLAMTQEQMGLVVQSLETFQKALKQAPNDGDVLQDLGIAYFKGGKLSDAIIY